jgi:hypothetical protein
MTHWHQIQFSASQLLWVGVIAFTAAILTGWFSTDSVVVSLGLAAASALISVAVVWFVGWTRRPR